MKNYIAILLLFAVPALMGMDVDRPNILDEKLSIKIHSAETLESVIFRIQANTGKSIGFTTHMLMPYKAKAADYRETTIRDILSQQLDGTPISYRIKRRQLILYNTTVAEK